MAKDKSNKLAEITRQVIPGATMSNWRKTGSYVPTFMTHGKGARVYDVDGNEYIDYDLGYGPGILGHSNSHLIKAIQEQVGILYNNAPTELQTRAAQKIKDHLASAELVRFANSGSESTINVFRVARAYTGKNYIVRFTGHYHGSYDCMLGGIANDQDFPVPEVGSRDEDMLSVMANTAGRADHALKDSFLIEWNDLPAIDKLFKDHGDKIAAVIMEPAMVNFGGCMPEPGYLEGVRKLCDDYGVVLIFDEVLTGFRIGLKGAQGYFGVTPDITTLGKALGGGFPVSGFCGKKEIMDVLTETKAMGGGTYNGNPLAMAAVIATIEELEKDNGAAYQEMERLGNKLKQGLDQIVNETGSDMLIQGFPTTWTYTFSKQKKVINHQDNLKNPQWMVKAGAFGDQLKAQGVLSPAFRFCTSAAHTEKDVNETLKAARTAIIELEKSFQ